jgi:hypothetical protein
MTVGLVDTCVIIDFLRDRPEAVEFIHDSCPTRRVYDHGRRALRRRAHLNRGKSNRGLTTWQGMAEKHAAPARA